VIFASPVAQPPSVRHSRKSSGPAARWIAPSTPRRRGGWCWRIDDRIYRQPRDIGFDGAQLRGHLEIFCSQQPGDPGDEAEPGMVKIHAQTMLPATPQRTAESFCTEPTPMIDR